MGELLSDHNWQVEPCVGTRFGFVAQGRGRDHMDNGIARQIRLITRYNKLSSDLCPGVLINPHTELGIKALILRHGADLPSDCTGVDGARCICVAHLDIVVYIGGGWYPAAGNVVDAI